MQEKIKNDSTSLLRILKQNTTTLPFWIQPKLHNNEKGINIARTNEEFNLPGTHDFAFAEARGDAVQDRDVDASRQRQGEPVHLEGVEGVDTELRHPADEARDGVLYHTLQTRGGPCRARVDEVRWKE